MYILFDIVQEFLMDLSGFEVRFDKIEVWIFFGFDPTINNLELNSNKITLGNITNFFYKQIMTVDYCWVF